MTENMQRYGSSMTNALPKTSKATKAWPSYYLEGTVTHFNPEKGFGFVKYTDGREFFFGFQVVEGKRLPRLGDKVDFLPSFKDAKPGKAPEITEFFPPEALQFIEGRKAGY